MSLCECGCGGEASLGKRFILGHHMRVKEIMQKQIEKHKETSKINQEIREGKRPVPELPFCACGCGGRVTKPENKYIKGHNMRGKNSHMYGKKGKESPRYGKESWCKGKTKYTDERVKKIGETFKKNYRTGKIKIWCKGLTKETNESLMRHSEFLQIFYLDKNNHPMYGKHHSEESKQKNRESNLGRKHSDETKQKIKDSHSTEEAKQRHREAVIENLKNGIYNRKPTAPELRYKEFCEEDNLPFRYTGDGQFWIGGKHKKVNPDFIDDNGRRIAVEILGDWWHSALFNNRVKDDDLKNREKHYRRYKWKVIFIWESDIMRPEGEEFVLSLLRKEGII